MAAPRRQGGFSEQRGFRDAQHSPGRGAPSSDYTGGFMRRAAFGLWLKLSITFGCTIAVIILVIGFIIGLSTKNAVEKEIDLAGIKLVKALGSVDADFWRAWQEQNWRVADMYNYIKTINPYVSPDAEELAQEILDALENPPPDSIARAALSIKFKNWIETRIKESGESNILGTLVSHTLGPRDSGRTVQSDVIQVGVLLGPPGREELVAVAAGEGYTIEKPEWRRYEREIDGESAWIDGVEICDTTVKDKGPCRVFKIKIYDSGSPDDAAGFIEAYISKRSIKEATGAVTKTVAVWGVIGVIVGAAVAVLFSLYLTSPVKMLISDVQEVARGNLEHRTTAKSSDEIGVLARAFNNMTQNLRSAIDTQIAMMADKMAVEHELSIAAGLQQRLLPQSLPQLPGVDVYAFYAPSKEVGGDYYDFVPVDRDNIGIVIADVSGKGVPGAFIMSMARSLIRMAAAGNPSPADVLKKVNKILARDVKKGMFVTCQYLVLNVANRVFTVASAGHNPLLIHRPSTGAIEEINPKGVALGLDEGKVFDRSIKEAQIAVNPGDRIFIYTDGVSEAMSEDRAEYGLERLLEVVAHTTALSSYECLTSVLQDIKRHQGNAPQHDDITMVTVRFA